MTIDRNRKRMDKTLAVITEFGKKWRLKYNNKKSEIVYYGPPGKNIENKTPHKL